jgi:hypothetical protein
MVSRMLARRKSAALCSLAMLAEIVNGVHSFASSSSRGFASASAATTRHRPLHMKVETRKTSRREVIAGSSAAAIATVVSYAARAAQSRTEDPQPSLSLAPADAARAASPWMAAPGDVYERACARLAKEADAAAQLVTPDVRRAYERVGVAVVRGVVSQEWLQRMRVGCDL